MAARDRLVGLDDLLGLTDPVLAALEPAVLHVEGVAAEPRALGEDDTAGFRRLDLDLGGLGRPYADAADPPARVLVVDCEVMFGMDYTGVETLEGLLEDLRKRDIDVRLARVHQTVLERLRTSRTLTSSGRSTPFRHVEDATAGDRPAMSARDARGQDDGARLPGSSM